jgi:type I restriction enzyme, S subunit
MKTVELQQVTTIIAGQSPESSTYNSIADGLPFFQGKADFQEKSPKVRIWCNSAKRKEAEPGDILMSVRAPVGSVNICNQKCIIGRGLSAIRPHANLNNYFLYYYLKCNEKNVASLGTGSTFQAITQTTLKRLEVPLPPLDDQIRIATLLSKVENLIFCRREQLKQLDELLKSVFLEMFGDPVRNEMGWETVPFSDILKDIESGWSPVCEARAASSSEWGVLKLGAITSCVFKDDENKALLPDVQPKTKNEVQIGDLLFSRKNTYDLVAACVYVFNTRSKLMISDLIFRFVFNDNSAVSPLYIWKLLINDSQRKKIQSLAGGAAGSMPNISKVNLRTILIPLPPLELQKRFARIVIKVESMKAHYSKSLTHLEALYGTLSQKSFKGESDLLRVTLVDEGEPVTGIVFNN